VLTGVRLNPSGNLSSTNIVKEGDLLTKNGSKIGFTETLGGNFRSVNPNRHVNKVRDKHADTWQLVKASHRILIKRNGIPM